MYIIVDLTTGIKYEVDDNLSACLLVDRLYELDHEVLFYN